MSEESQRSEALFDTLNKNKQKRKRKVILTVAIVLGVIAVILVGLVLTLRRQVETRFAASATEVQSYTVQTGTITTLVSGVDEDSPYLLAEQEESWELVPLANTGADSGGSSKFAVEVTIPKEGDMLAGMSATATLPLYTKMDVLTIPMPALTEDGPTTTVYTALDGKTGEPTAPVEVTLGVSNRETAEILSGLRSGDRYYYAYYDTLELSQEVESAGFSVRGR